MSWENAAWELEAENDLLPVHVSGQERQDRLIPLINVVFLLLAFFIISGTFRAADTLEIEPPTVATAGTLDPESGILFMDRAGALALGNRRIGPDQAVEELSRRLSGDPDGEVQIKADAQVKAKDILPLLRRLADAKITSVRLIAMARKAAP